MGTLQSFVNLTLKSEMSRAQASGFGETPRETIGWGPCQSHPLPTASGPGDWSRQASFVHCHPIPSFPRKKTVCGAIVGLLGPVYTHSLSGFRLSRALGTQTPGGLITQHAQHNQRHPTSDIKGFSHKCSPAMISLHCLMHAQETSQRKLNLKMVTPQ